MKKLILILWFMVGISTLSIAGSFSATGLNDPSERWNYFVTTGFTVLLDNYGQFVQIEIQSRSHMSCTNWRCPTGQPFQVKIPFRLPEGAVLTSAGLFDGSRWIEAKPTDLFKAEEIYNQTPKTDLRLLLRRVVQRDYSGQPISKFELRLSPVKLNKDFVFRIKYVVPVTPGIWTMRTASRLGDFFESCPTNHCNLPVSFYFFDHDFPSSQPEFIYGIRYATSNPFVQRENKWETSVPAKYIDFYSGVGIAWFRPLSKGPELRLFENESGKFYSLMMNPPLQPAERLPRHVLIVYDLAENIPGQFTRSQLINEFKVMAVSGLADTDSIDVLLTDFVPKTLRSTFVPATNETVEQLFREIGQAPQPHLSTLPQLLREAKDFFNQRGVPGEIWLISSATKHSKPLSVANEIIDLSLRRFKQPVTFRIFDCSVDDWETMIWLNGKYYLGNDYLYENLARLSHGAIVKAKNESDWHLRDALANVFFSAVDAVEVDALPQGGFHESRFLLNGGRSHFPIAWPYMELGRYEGDLPFSVNYFGKVDGQLYKHTVSISDTFNTPHRDLLATMWNAYHVEDLLREPQSDATIKEIGRVATKYHFLSPYNGFVIPGPSGLVAFKRLMEVDTSQAEPLTDETQPTRFDMAAFPNPFNLSTTIRIALPVAPKAETADIQIYNLLGKRVRNFRFDLPKGSSSLQFTWDGASNDGGSLPSGVYLILGEVGNFHKLLKITLLK